MKHFEIILKLNVTNLFCSYKLLFPILVAGIEYNRLTLMTNILDSMLCTWSNRSVANNRWNSISTLGRNHSKIFYHIRNPHKSYLFHNALVQNIYVNYRQYHPLNHQWLILYRVELILKYKNNIKIKMLLRSTDIFLKIILIESIKYESNYVSCPLQFSWKSTPQSREFFFHYRICVMHKSHQY